MSGCVRALGHNTRDEVFLGVGTIEGSQAAPDPRAQTNKEAKAEKLVSENQTLVCKALRIYIIHTTNTQKLAGASDARALTQ